MVKGGIVGVHWGLISSFQLPNSIQGFWQLKRMKILVPDDTINHQKRSLPWREFGRQNDLRNSDEDDEEENIDYGMGSWPEHNDPTTRDYVTIQRRSYYTDDDDGRDWKIIIALEGDPSTTKNNAQ